MDSKMKRLMAHPDGPKSTRFFVNETFKMPSYLRNFEYCGFRDVILKYFYENNHSFSFIFKRKHQV